MANQMVTNPTTGKSFYATPGDYEKYINDGYLAGKQNVTPSKEVLITNPTTGKSFYVSEDRLGTDYKGYLVAGQNTTPVPPTPVQPAFNKDQYAKYLTEAANQLAQAEAEAKRQAQLGAYQRNEQALNSQQSTVGNNYSSLINQLTATKQSQLPQYQSQRDQASAEAAAQLRRTQALNALTGKFHSGTNRSQMSDVGLARSSALGGINQAQNQFETGITNEMSEADARRVAALNDIAEKLSLNKQQYNSGTLSIDSQLASTEAANASKAMADSMTRAEQIEQQKLDDAYRQEQFEYEKSLNEWEQAFKEKQYESGLAIDQAQLAASLARGSGGSSGSGAKVTTASRNDVIGVAISVITDALKSGQFKSADDAMEWLRNNTSNLVSDGATITDIASIEEWINNNGDYLIPETSGQFTDIPKHKFGLPTLENIINNVEALRR